MKKEPQRSCVICRTQKNKSELLRIVKNKEGIKVDTTGKQSGRGAYICYSEQCLEKAIKSKKMEKTLESEIDDMIYNEMKNLIKNKIGGEVIGQSKNI